MHTDLSLPPPPLVPQIPIYDYFPTNPFLTFMFIFINYWIQQFFMAFGLGIGVGNWWLLKEGQSFLVGEVIFGRFVSQWESLYPSAYSQH